MPILYLAFLRFTFVVTGYITSSYKQLPFFLLTVREELLLLLSICNLPLRSRIALLSGHPKQMRAP